MRDGALHLMGEGREPGLHLSEIVRAMMEAADLKVTGIEGEEPEVRPQAGFWWEAALEHAMREHAKLDAGRWDTDIQWQVRLLQDRIHMTPDGFDWKHFRFVSVKLTWKTMRRWTPEEAEMHFWPWFVHDMGAINAWNQQRGEGQPEVWTVRYYHFWAGGNYIRGGPEKKGPQPTYADVTYTPQEVEANWKTVIRYRDWIEEQRRANGVRVSD